MHRLLQESIKGVWQISRLPQNDRQPYTRNPNRNYVTANGVEISGEISGIAAGCLSDYGTGFGLLGSYFCFGRIRMKRYRLPAKAS